MLREDKCKFGHNCKFSHPPADERKRLWDYHTAAQQRGGRPEESVEQRVIDPAASSAAADQNRDRSMDEGEPSEVGAHQATHPRPGHGNWSPPAPPAGNGLERARIAHRGTTSHPSSVLHPFTVPHLSGLLPTPTIPDRGARKTYSRTKPNMCERDVASASHHRKTMSHFGTISNNPNKQGGSDAMSIDYSHSGFDPRLSKNRYVNGELRHVFMWRNPLCVRCGKTGHLPKQCRNVQLSADEQGYLKEIVVEEQNRSNMERGVVGRKHSRMHDSPDQPPSRAMFSEKSRPGFSARKDRDLSTSGSQYDPFRYSKSNRRRDSLPGDDISQDEDKVQGEKMDFTVEAERDTEYALGGDNPNMPNIEYRSDRGRWEDEVEADGPLRDGPPRHHRTGNEAQAREAESASRPGDEVFKKPALPVKPAPVRDMGATKRLSSGEAKPVGPHPSTIRVAAPYMKQSAIEKRLYPSSLDAQERSQAEVREDNVRLQGVTWIDNVRRALQLPFKTYSTACLYYHKFRMGHPNAEYNWQDAAAASLLMSCKTEDTLKKSRDILAASYNLKIPPGHEQAGTDDPMFEMPSRVVIGLERLVVESIGFDFRSRSPHITLYKMAQSLGRDDEMKAIAQNAWSILTDLHRTFAPLKQTSATMALACLELATHLKGTSSEEETSAARDRTREIDTNKWYTTREEIMETLLDALDLYTHHTPSTILGTQYPLDVFLRIRLMYNKECSESNLSRYSSAQPPPSPENALSGGSTLRVSNGHPTPVSPPQSGPQPAQIFSLANFMPVIPEGGGTLRFMLDPQRAIDERAEVNRYFVEEWEEYEEEVEVHDPQPRSRERDRDRDRERDRHHPHTDRGRSRGFDDRRMDSSRENIRGPPERERERDRFQERERDVERDRPRVRDRERDRRFDDRRFDDRERDRRYDDRRDRSRPKGGGRDRGYEDRRYEDDRRRGREDRR